MRRAAGRRRLETEQGTALVIALMATALLTALGTALVLLTITETTIATNYRIAEEALYAADAGIERVLSDLLAVARWNDVLATGGGPRSLATSSFFDSTLTPMLPSGPPLDLTTETTSLQRHTDTTSAWGANTPAWRLYACGPIRNLLPTGTVRSLMYVAVWVGDDPLDADNDPSSDANGVLMLRATAYGPSNARRIVEVTVARGPSEEIEPGPVGQTVEAASNQGAPEDVESAGEGPADPPAGNGAGHIGIRMLSWREVR